MPEESTSKQVPIPEGTKVKEMQRWGISPSQVLYHFGTSGISSAGATAVTHPLDVVKVRLQMQFVGQRGPLTGMGRLFYQIVKSQGVGGLYLGLAPALTRSVSYGGLRLGLYEPSKYICGLAFESTNILTKIASGAFTGAVATALTNPVDIVKVRLQMNTEVRRGPYQELQKIVSEEGMGALWKGVGPAMARASALTASQLATYDESKRALMQWTSLVEGFRLHLMYADISSTMAGIVGTIVTAPIDTVKTRLMLQRESREMGIYRNGFHCAYKVLITEGSQGLYKGGLTIFARLGPQTTITLMLCEKLRELAGLKAL